MAYLPKYRVNCRTCQLTKGTDVDKRIMRGRISHAAFDRQYGDETLDNIAAELGVGIIGLRNHTKKHLIVKEIGVQTRELRVIKKTQDIKGSVAKKLELSFDHDDINAEPQAIEALKEYLIQGHALIKEGKLPINAMTFLQAVRISVDYESKKKDREVDIIKTMYRFSSGQKEPDEGIKDTAEPTEGVVGGAEKPGDIHNEATRDAITRWAAALPETNSVLTNPN